MALSPLKTTERPHRSKVECPQTERQTYLHNPATLEKIDRLAIGKRIRQSWNTAIGVDLQEPVFLLGAVVQSMSMLNLSPNAEGILTS